MTARWEMSRPTMIYFRERVLTATEFVFVALLLIISLFVDLEHAYAQQAANITGQFWGADLTTTFPEWEDSRVTLNGVFEGNKGSLIAVVGVGKGNKVQAWDIDLIHKVKLPAPSDAHLVASFENNSGEAFKEIQIGANNKSIEEAAGIGVQPGTTKIISGQLHLDADVIGSCDDPVAETLDLVRFENLQGRTFWATVERTMAIMKESRKDGISIGGGCGTFDYLKPLIVKTFATTSGGSLVFDLADGSVIVQSGYGVGQHAIILRFDRTLKTEFKSDFLVLMNANAYEDLVNTRGVFAAQELLLSKLK